jgi:hypothetical protein
MGRDRDRPSWRELDRRRDQRGGRAGGGQKEERPLVSSAAQKQYRAALDKAFDSGQLGRLVERMSDKAPNRNGDASTNGAGHGAATVGEAAAPPHLSEGSPDSEPTPAPPRRAALPAPAASPDAGDREERQKLFAKAKAAVGKSDIERAVDAFVKRFGWPSDFEFLSNALEHHRADTVTAALGELERMMAKEKPRRAGMLSARLRALEELSDDVDIRSRAAALRKKL